MHRRFTHEYRDTECYGQIMAIINTYIVKQ